MEGLAWDQSTERIFLAFCFLLTHILILPFMFGCSPRSSRKQVVVHPNECPLALGLVQC